MDILMGTGVTDPGYKAFPATRVHAMIKGKD